MMRVKARAGSAVPLLNSAKRTVEVVPTADFDGIHALWTALEPRSDASFFQSWGWIGCWLRTLPRDQSVFALIVRDDTKIVGLSLFGKSRYVRRGFISSLGYYLNETGSAYHDALTVEYNGPLAERGSLAHVVDACVASLLGNSEEWDELFISGVDLAQCAAFEAAGRKHHLTHRILDEKPSYYVDLDAVRTKGDYLRFVSQNTRYQIRRAMRLYEDEGRVAFDNAASVDEALVFFAGLEELHQAYWRARGRPGSFSNPFFVRFHQQLIRDRFAAGEIQLARISSPGKVIGYLYNFVYRGRVYAYQSGFQYEADNKRKPGLVSHYLTIEHHLRSGARVYDFLAGEGQHKQSLATNAHSLVWLVEQRDRLKFRMENSLRRLKERLVPR